MLLAIVLDLTIAHEHHIAKILCSHSREAGPRRRRLRLLTDLTVLDHTIIKTVDTLRQVQLACTAFELC